jgi:hypothetical protein
VIRSGAPTAKRNGRRERVWGSKRGLASEARPDRIVGVV